MKKKLLVSLATVLFLFSVTGIVEATTIYVSQGGVALGTITPYSGTTLSASANYVQHGQPVNGPTTNQYEGQIYFYENNVGLYFNMHFGTGGAFKDFIQDVDWDITVSGSTTNPEMIESDDPGEFIETGTDDLFEGRWAYWNNYGDGGVLGSLSGSAWTIAIDPVSYGTQGNLHSLLAYSYSSTAISLDINLTDDILLSAAPIPEPTTMLLLGSGLIGLAGARKKFKK